MNFFYLTSYRGKIKRFNFFEKSYVKQKGKCPKLSIKNSEKKSLKNKRYIIPFRTTAWKSQKRMIKKGSALF